MFSAKCGMCNYYCFTTYILIMAYSVEGLNKLSKQELISIVKRLDATVQSYATHIQRLEKILKDTGRVVYTTNPYISKDKQPSLFD